MKSVISSKTGSGYSPRETWFYKGGEKEPKSEGLNKIIRYNIKFTVCEVKKGVNESVLRWFGKIERIYMIAKGVYSGEFMGKPYSGRQRKKWIDSVNDWLKKKEE